MNLDQIVFIDIETVPMVAHFDQLDSRYQELWKKKMTREMADMTEPDLSELFFQKAGIFAEYGKIICISVGMFAAKEQIFRLKSFWSDDEKELLQEFTFFCAKLKKTPIFCGHNIREFDIPYISRRLLIQGMPIPSQMDFQSKKPWEVELYDTLQLWKFGDYKNFTSLELLTTIFNIPSPKSNLDGSMVGTYYWKENRLKEIVQYCERDVIAVIQLYHKLHQNELLDDSKFQIV